MVVAIEKKIQKMLSSGHSSASIAQYLLRKKNLSKDPESFLAICRFMYQAGLNKLIIETAISRLKKKEVAPWAFIIEILESQNISIPKEKRAFFIKGILEQKQIPALITSHSWDKYHPELKELKVKMIKEISKQKNRSFIKHIEDLEFIQAQGILKKEEEILKKLKKIDPENPEIQEKWIQFREKWGRHIIQKKKKNLLNKHNVSHLPSEKEKNHAEKISKSVKKILKDTPEKSYNMALLFSFASYPHLALQILKDHLNTVPAQWLYLDLLLQSALYLDCLSFLDTMEVRYSNDPETVFALTYIRAKAYYGLGKKKKAKDILSHLLEVRPNYRLTHHLLKQWETGAENLD